MPLRMPRGVPALMLVLTLVLMNGAVQANPVLPVAASAPAAAGDWPMYGHDAARTNYNPAETTISAANVDQLVQRWEYHTGSGASLTSSAPSVANGRVYVGTSVASGDNFFALDAVTGAFAWSADLGYSNACWHVGIGATPAIAGNLVVAGGGNATYYGLDAATGAPRWSHALGAGASAFAWASPLLANGRAYIGVASYCDNPSVQGAVQALDLSTGGVLANQPIVPSGRAGGGVWNSPALSPDGSTLVAATGEDYAGYNGAYTRASRRSNTLLALDLLTDFPLLRNLVPGRWTGQAYPECAALAKGAADLDPPAMLLDQRFADRQPQAGSANIAGQRAIDLMEFVEDALVIFGGDPTPKIVHCEGHRADLLARAQLDVLARFGKLDCVRQQVHQHLERAVAVGADRRQPWLGAQINADVAPIGEHRDLLCGGAA